METSSSSRANRYALASLICTAFASGVPVAAAAEDGDVVGKSGAQHVLDEALDDERHAMAFYRAVMERFGELRPFSNIVHAEQRHANALLQQYERLGLTQPANRWSSHAFRVPDTFAEACDAAEISEILNATMYDKLIAQAPDNQVRGVFEQLRAASQERHLRAFRKHSNGWHAVEAEDLSKAQQTQQSQALKARDAVFGKLLNRLSEEMEAGGPVEAIEVCKREAPKIAQEVGKKRNLRIGRTSWKLRNRENTGPVWAKLVLHEKPDTPQLAAAQDGRLGVTIPILVGENCLKCHGPVDKIDPAVKAQLSKLYPEDEAVGFKEGDLRGWFWVEVPPR